MKGISLSIEAVIIIILAVLVLVAIFFFFSSSYSPGENIVFMRSQQTNYCSKYASIDPGCNNPGSVGIANELSGVCQKLGYSSCEEDASASCIKQCCSSVCLGAGGGGGGPAPIDCSDKNNEIKPCCEQGGECVFVCPAAKQIGVQWVFCKTITYTPPGWCCEL